MNAMVTDSLKLSSESKVTDYIDEWFLVGSPVQCTLILTSYLAFVLKVGPYFMKERAPFKLTNIILVYNILQVILSGYIFKLSVSILYKVGLASDKCINESEELQYDFYYSLHIYLLAKLSELLDTIFFVLRKKKRQVSVLHVYHHCIVFFYTWALLSFKQTLVSFSVVGCMNSLVHLIMYSYYAVSVYPNVCKYIWYKKYITTIQMIQFVLIIMYTTFEYMTSRCKFSGFLILHVISNTCIMLYLFADFYINAYKSPQTLKKE